MISDGTVERITLGGKMGKRTAKRGVLAKGFSTPIGVARLPDGRIIFDAWGQSHPPFENSNSDKITSSSGNLL